MPDNSDVPTLSYEAARDELVDVVARLEAGGEPLERSLDLWERGEALAARCQQWLDGARERLAAAQDATPSAAQIERQLDAAPRVKLRPDQRVTVREFKRRPELRRMAMPSTGFVSIVSPSKKGGDWMYVLSASQP